MHVYSFLIVLIFLIAGNSPVFANDDSLRFALVPKQSDVPFFREIEQGCKEEAKKYERIECIYVGPRTSDFRLQDKIISDLIDNGIDGIAVSVINSEFLVHNSLKKAKLNGIPVVTFDSDLSSDVLARDMKFRRAYVGTNNFEMGRQLGKGLVEIKNTGTFAIISGNPTAPNLNERIQGLRSVLNSSSWREYSRSPVYINDAPERSLNALTFMLKSQLNTPGSLDAVIAMGAFLQSDYDKYKKLIEPYLDNEKALQVRIISADTSPHQIKLLEEGFADLNVGQATHQMGAMSLDLLYKIHRGFDVDEINYTPLNVCRQGQEPLCVLTSQSPQKDKDS